MLIQIITAVRHKSSLSTALSFIFLFILRPAAPPPIPPAAISTRAPMPNCGTERVMSVVKRFASWLNRIIYRLFCAAAFVSMLKKKNSTTRLIGPPPIPQTAPTADAEKLIARNKKYSIYIIFSLVFSSSCNAALIYSQPEGTM